MCVDTNVGATLRRIFIANSQKCHRSMNLLIGANHKLFQYAFVYNSIAGQAFTFNSKLSMLRCLYEFKSLELCLRNNCAVFAMITFFVCIFFSLWYIYMLFFCCCYFLVNQCVFLCGFRLRRKLIWKCKLSDSCWI